jgi:hypothetical protein
MKTINQLEQLKTQQKNLSGIISEAKRISEDILRDLFIYTIKENMNKNKAVHPNTIADFCVYVDTAENPCSNFNFYAYDFRTFHGWKRNLDNSFYGPSDYRRYDDFGPSVSSFSAKSFLYDCERHGSARAIELLDERILLTKMMSLDWNQIADEFVELIQTVTIEGMSFYMEAMDRLDKLEDTMKKLQAEVDDYEEAVIMETIKACDIECVENGKVKSNMDLYWANTEELRTEDPSYEGENDKLTQKHAGQLTLHYNQQDYGYARCHGFRILKETPKGFVIAGGHRPWVVTGKYEESQAGNVKYSSEGFRVHKDYFKTFIKNLGLLQTLRGDDDQ